MTAEDILEGARGMDTDGDGHSNADDNCGDRANPDKRETQSTSLLT